MNLLLLAAMKKAIDDQNSSYRRSRGKSKKVSSKSSSSYTKTYSEYEYIMGIIKDDPVLKNFFEIIVDEGKKIDEIDAEKVRKKIEEKIRVQDERVKKIELLEKEIRESGLEIEEDVNYYDSVTVGIPVSETYKSPIDNNWKYVLVKRDFGLVYNGTKLYKSYFEPEKRDINPFENDYNDWFNNNTNIDEEIQKLEKKIKKLENKLGRRIIYKEDEKIDELKDLKNRYSNLLYDKKRGEELKRDKENFDKITPEQKEKIYEFYKLAEECKKTGKEIDIEKNIYLKITKNEEHYYSDGEFTEKRKKWQRTIKRLKESGEITEEMLDAVDTIFSEEGLGYEKYSEGISEYDMTYKGFSEDFKMLISWYLKERKENIYSKVAERKRVAYKVLEDKCGETLEKSNREPKETDSY